MIVYADILFMINFFSDYLAIYGTSKVTYIYTKMKRIILGALAGGIYSIFIFDERLSWLYCSFIKIFVSSVIIFISFGKINLKNYFKLILNFYIISFVMSGMIIFLSNIDGVFTMSDGFFLWDSNLFIIFTGGLAAIISVVYFLKKLGRNNIKHKEKINVDIHMEGKNISVVGMMDSGNLLLEPINQYPVIIVDYNSIKEILSDDLKEYLKKGNTLTNNINRNYIHKIRIIPYKTVGTTSVLKGFKPDYIVINNKIIKDVVIAVSYDELFDNNEYNAILNPQI